MRNRNLLRSFVIVIIIITALNSLNIIRLFYPLYYSEHIKAYSEKYDLSPYLVAAVIKTESNFRPNAKSPKNAHGLMQITSSTAEWAAKEMNLENYSVEMLKDPEFNIRMGCWYLDNLNKEFNDNTDLVLAAYNGGRGNVQKWLSDLNHSKDGKNLYYIPFKETDKYIKRVKVNYNIYKLLYGARFNE